MSSVANQAMLLPAIIFITLALVFYTIGVWSEKFQGVLKPWHLIAFWAGFLCDTIGTSCMGIIAGPDVGISFHLVTGLLAIIVMFVHAIWATIVIKKNNESMKKSFHKLSIAVWIIWLIPYLSGMIFGMTIGK